MGFQVSIYKRPDLKDGIMGRKIFFWLEKLKISRAERYAVITLMAVLLVLVMLNAVVTPSSPFAEDRYAELDRAFQRRKEMLGQQERQLMARYQSGSSTTHAPSDTLPTPPSQEKEQIRPTHVIDINVAGNKALQALPGIGASYAAHIVEYRQRHGPFTSKNELLQVKGIGEKRLEKIRPLIKIGEPAKSAETIQAVEPAMPQKIINTQKRESKAEHEEYHSIVNVNTASSKALQKLPGIGPTYADRIIKYRQTNGAFDDMDELLKIKGIGKKRLAKIKPFVKLTGQ